MAFTPYGICIPFHKPTSLQMDLDRWYKLWYEASCQRINTVSLAFIYRSLGSSMQAEEGAFFQQTASLQFETLDAKYFTSRCVSWAEGGAESQATLLEWALASPVLERFQAAELLGRCSAEPLRHVDGGCSVCRSV
jgi:hypothetical protein